MKCINQHTKGLKKHPRTRGLKQRGRSTYTKDKPTIISIVERGTRNTILVVEKNLSKDLIHNKIQTHCSGSIKVFTDDYTIYNGLKEHPQVVEHHIINDSKKEYADGENHVNNCENPHLLIRPYLNKFRGLSKIKLNTYVKFYQFTLNNGINWFQIALQTILQ